MTSEDYAAVALSRVPSVGTQLYRNLIDHFGDAAAALRATPRELLRVRGVARKTAAHFAAEGHYREADAVAQFADRHPLRIFHVGQETYPASLRGFPTAPAVLYYYGTADLDNPYRLAVVGSRNMSAAGHRQIERLLDPLVQHGVLIVSGLAYGVDIAAHRRALQQGLPTLAVLGSGFEHIYPHQHHRVARKMAEQGGGLLSEYPPWQRPERLHFPARNRIVAMLAEMTVVVQSGTTGGSLITANMAREFGRVVGACPGESGNPYTAGCNMLIKEGRAVLVEEARDISRTLNWDAPGVTAPQLPLLDDLDEEALRIVRTLKQGERSMDELRHAGAFAGPELAAALLTLELRGLVLSLPGRRYRLQYG